MTLSADADRRDRKVIPAGPVPQARAASRGQPVKPDRKARAAKRVRKENPEYKARRVRAAKPARPASYRRSNR